MVTVAATRPGPVIPPDFLGLSLETPALHSAAIASSTSSLVHLLSGLGAGVLRISGNSVDHTQWLSSRSRAAPWATTTLTPADLQSVAALMRASGWRLSLGLDLGHTVPQSIVDEARAATSIIGPSLAGFELGNEPDLYTRPPARPFRSILGEQALRPPGWGLSDYEVEVARLGTLLAQAGVAAPLWGPDTATGNWLDGYATAAGVVALTPHLYPLDRCQGGRLTAKPSLSSLLARGVARHESLLVQRDARAAASRALPLRIDETNSVACAGQPGTSDTFGAALWALDYALIAARQGVAGLNFHGALGSCREGGTIVSPWYSPLCELAGGQLRARPEYYALLLLRSLEGCAFVSATYRTSRNVSVYALRAPDGTLRVVIDDMQLPAGAASRTGRKSRAGPVRVVLKVEPAYQHAGVTRLSAPSPYAKGAVTLGGASLRPDGTLPAPVPTAVSGSSGRFVLRVAAGSAAVVSLAP